MKSTLTLLMAIYLAFTTATLAQTGESTKKPGQQSQQGPIDILSDTNGFDMKPYVRQLQQKVRTVWYALVPESAKHKQGLVSIAFRVMRDGRVEDVKYATKSGKAALDEPAYEAIVESSPLPALPNEFACQSISFRFRFYYNRFPGSSEKTLNDQVVPCVTSKIKPVGPPEN